MSCWGSSDGQEWPRRGRLGNDPRRLCFSPPPLPQPTCMGGGGSRTMSVPSTYGRVCWETVSGMLSPPVWWRHRTKYRPSRKVWRKGKRESKRALNGRNKLRWADLQDMYSKRKKIIIKKKGVANPDAYRSWAGRLVSQAGGRGDGSRGEEPVCPSPSALYCSVAGSWSELGVWLGVVKKSQKSRFLCKS